MNENSKNCKNEKLNKLAWMVATYFLEEMCRLCAFTRENYKEAINPFNIKHSWEDTLNITQEDEMLKVL